MFDGVARFVRKLGRDPTAEWPPPHLDHVVIDTISQTVCGIKLPCEPAELRKIGRPSNRHSFAEKIAQYHELGATFWLGREGRVDDVGVCLIDMGDDGPPARRCEIIGPRGRCELTPASHIDALAAAVGEGRLDQLGDHREWTFRLGAFDMTAECATDGTVRYVHYFVV